MCTSHSLMTDHLTLCAPNYFTLGGMFEYVSGANFFGEIVEWTGYSIAAWSLPGFTFAALTFLNTFPRAVSHHM